MHLQPTKFQLVEMYLLNSLSNCGTRAETGKIQSTVSKAVGEPPFMLAISVYSAICDAISSVANYRTWPELDAPATPERVLRAIHALKDLEYIA